MKLIVGLGNPGKQYEKTRHNIGFMVLDALHPKLPATDLSEWSLSKKFNAIIAGGTVHSEKIILAKPMTYMNHSGQAVGLIGHYYKIPPRDVIVIHDEKDLPLGELKMQTGRGDAGHNGVKSIIDHIGKEELTRIRVGVAAKNERKMRDTAKFVLGRFGLLEKKLLTETIDRTADEVLKLIT